jgi:hypothetical protein
MAWFLQRGLDVVLERGRYPGNGRDDPAEASHRDDRQEHVGDLVLGRARRKRPGRAPLRLAQRFGIKRVFFFASAFLGVNAAGQSLEQVTKPLTSVAGQAAPPATTAAPTAA